jgi:hypothetical protein
MRATTSSAHFSKLALYMNEHTRSSDTQENLHHEGKTGDKNKQVEMDLTLSHSQYREEEGKYFQK